LLLLSKSDPLRWAPIWALGAAFSGHEDGSQRNRRRRRAGARAHSARKCPWGIRPPPPRQKSSECVAAALCAAARRFRGLPPFKMRLASLDSHFVFLGKDV
jgi:hypothetical protein